MSRFTYVTTAYCLITNTTTLPQHAAMVIYVWYYRPTAFRDIRFSLVCRRFHIITAAAITFIATLFITIPHGCLTFEMLTVGAAYGVIRHHYAIITVTYHFTRDDITVRHAGIVATSSACIR